MKGIKELLNKYSHTNLDGLMILFMEDHQTYQTMKFNKLAIKFVIMMVEILFIPMVNYLYHIKLELPSLNHVVHELKEIESMRYVADKLPEGYKEFFNSSEVLKGYFKNLAWKFKDLISSYQSILKEKGNKNI